MVVTCVCCGRWRVERVLRDETHASAPQRGGRLAGEREIWRLHHLRDDGAWVRWRDYDDPGELAAELVRKRVQLPAGD